MRVLFAGTPATAIPALERILQANFEVVGVLTAPPAPAGRGRKLTPSAVAEFAHQQGLDVLDFADVNSESALTEIQNRRPDVVAVVAYGQLLKLAALEIPPHGWINLHFSLLPLWRGAAPVQSAILAGDEITGATTFQIETGLDTGPIFGSFTTDIDPKETAGELLARLAESGAELLVQTLHLIESGKAAPISQTDENASYAPKISVADGQINWHQPALAITRRVRAFNPSPYAWSTFAGERILIGKAQISAATDLLPSEISIEKNQVLVGTGSTAIEVLEVKPAGKGWMKAADWARGVRTDNWKFDV